MEKDYKIEFLIEGKHVGESTLTAMGKTLLTHAAEDEFFAVLRKNESRLLEEAEVEEKEQIIETLTKEQEDKLQLAFADSGYHGTDDDMPDAFEDWLVDLSLDEVKSII